MVRTSKPVHIAGEVGIACLLEGQMKLSMCQIIDTTVGSRHVRAQIQLFEPSTVILLETNHVDIDCLNRSVKDACEALQSSVVHVKRRCFDDTCGFELISEFSAPPGWKDSDLSPSNYLAVGASGWASAMKLTHTLLVSARLLMNAIATFRTSDCDMTGIMHYQV